jgi:hypothetical protein
MPPEARGAGTATKTPMVNPGRYDGAGLLNRNEKQDEAGTGTPRVRQGRKRAGPPSTLYHLASKMLVTLERMPLGLAWAARSS